MKQKNTYKLLEIIEGGESASDKFHSITNNKFSNITYSTKVLDSWIKIHFKTYPRLDKISLNKKHFENKLAKLFIDRRSNRQFSSKPISKKDLFCLLFLAAGITNPNENIDSSKRAYPSAGGRYPLEIYPLILNSKEINKGLYHYNVKDNSMELLLEKDLSNWLVKNTYNEDWIKNAAVVFIITGVLDRIRIKYGDRGYRLILIETGHLAQNILLISTALGLNSCPLAGYIDEEVNKLLDINLQKEKALYMIAVGKK